MKVAVTVTVDLRDHEIPNYMRCAYGGADDVRETVLYDIAERLRKSDISDYAQITCKSRKRTYTV